MGSGRFSLHHAARAAAANAGALISGAQTAKAARVEAAMTSDPNSADEDFRFGAEPLVDKFAPGSAPPIDSAYVDRASRFVLALLFAWASPFVVDGFASALARNLRDDSFIVMLAIGVVLGKFGLLSMWLAWGSSRFIWRMLIVIVSVSFTAMVVSIDRGGASQFFLVVFLLTILCAGAIAAPRYYVRWVEQWTTRLDEPRPARRNQFSILDLLVWTTVVAIVCGLISGIGFPQGMSIVEFGFLCLIAGPIVAFVVLLAMWTELNRAESIGFFVLVNYIFAVALAFIVGSMSRAPWWAIGYMFASLATGISCILGVLYLFRNRGDRLVRASGPGGAIHATAAADIDDESGEWA
jgi:hypothetical protein